MDGTKMTTFTTQDRQDAQREPVAYVVPLGNPKDPMCNVGLQFNKPDNMEGVTPLFAQHGSLTLTQIRNLAMQCEDPDFKLDNLIFNWYDFARAIERAHGITE